MGIRTPDLFHAMEARYQLRHSPLQVPVELSVSQEWLEPSSATLGGPVALGGLVALLLGPFAQAGRAGWGGAEAGGGQRVEGAAAGGAPEQDDGDQADDPFQGAEGAGQRRGLAAGAEVEGDQGGQREQHRRQGAGAAFAAAGQAAHQQPQPSAGGAEGDDREDRGAQRRVHVGVGGAGILSFDGVTQRAEGAQAGQQAHRGHARAHVHGLGRAVEGGRDGQAALSRGGGVGARASGGAGRGPLAGGGAQSGRVAGLTAGARAAWAGRARDPARAGRSARGRAGAGPFGGHHARGGGRLGGRGGLGDPGVWGGPGVL